VTSASEAEGGTGGQPLRRDAERNRARILAAARTVFAAEGLGASMASVARQAGVGIATLFRHFAAKEDLIAAVLANRMDAYVEAANQALSEPDPWRGLTGFLDAVCVMQAADSGFADMVTMTFPAATGLEKRRAEAYNAVTELIARAKSAGRLRDDFTPEDLLLLHMAVGGVISGTGVHAPGAWRRVAALLIQAYQAPARGPLPAAPAPSALYRAMLTASRACQATREQAGEEGAG
jgi:AcrR family transcriptional regulator